MFRDFRTRIVFWVIVPLAAILVGVAFLGVTSHQMEMRNLVEERDRALARIAAARISEALADRVAILQALDPTTAAAWEGQRNAFDGGIALLSSDGEMLQAVPSQEIWAPRRAALAEMLSTRSVFSAPTFEQGAVRVIAIVPKGSAFIAGAFTLPPLANVGIGERGVAYLVDASGRVAAHPNSQQIGADLSAHDGIRDVLRGESGATFHRDANGTERVVGFAPVAPTGWGLIIEEPWADVVTPMFQFSVLLPFLLLIVAVVALGAIFLGVRGVMRPLKNLAQAANRIAAGEYHAAERPLGGIREIDELRETLDRMAREAHAAQDTMQSYISTIMRGQEDERIRLARELHDDTIQSLIALQQRIEMTEKALRKDPTLAAHRFDELRSLVGDTLTSVRRFVRDLRPTYLEDLGLIPALEMLTREVGASLSIEGEEARLDTERELALYRIVQEALRNVGKHARASQVTVKLCFEPKVAIATIEDNGVGFTTARPDGFVRAGHFGLMGMQERAQLFGGEVLIRSAPGQGTRVVARVPIGTGEKE